MTTQITTASKRDMDALLYLRGADRWQKRVILKDGRRAYGIPSRTRDGLYHLTDGSNCSCEDRIRNGVRCAHMIAATLYRMERAALEAAYPAATPMQLDDWASRQAERIDDVADLASESEIEAAFAGVKADQIARDEARGRVALKMRYEDLFGAD